MKASRFLKILLPLVALLATGCNKSHAGDYYFGLGKDGQAQIGVGIRLHPIEKVISLDGAKPAFDLNIVYHTAPTPSSSSSASSSASTKVSSEPTVTDVDILFSGFYEITDLEVKGGKELVLQIDKIGGTELDPDVQKLIFEFSSLAVMASIGDNSVSITIPVSFNDLAKQIEWYSTPGRKRTDPLPEVGSPEHFWTVTIGLNRI